MPNIDVELERDGKFVVHQTSGNEDALRVAQIQVAMANGVIAEGHIVAVGDDGFVALGHGERHEIIRLAAEGGGDGHGDGGNHALEIIAGNGDLAGAGVADAIWRLGNRTALHDLRGAAGDRGGGLRHDGIVA